MSMAADGLGWRGRKATEARTPNLYFTPFRGIPTIRHVQRFRRRSAKKKCRGKPILPTKP